ncbi:MAG: hypothetical protein PHX15_02225 [Candidatus Nanoarchaeia archaeon]|nr:hypothetical protein [Candidatus Nanoarchaeia archaeon]MDD4563360.1 hypothetical protein [Candidatus Nanoarchaeia archaeon]
MVESEPLYFLTGIEQYKKAKIGLLAAKSYALYSRNILTNLKNLNKQEEDVKKEIKKSSTEVLSLMKEMQTEDLPKVKSVRVNIKEIKKKVVIPSKDKTVNERSDIDEELEEINKKLEELTRS